MTSNHVWIANRKNAEELAAPRCSLVCFNRSGRHIEHDIALWHITKKFRSCCGYSRGLTGDRSEVLTVIERSVANAGDISPEGGTQSVAAIEGIRADVCHTIRNLNCGNI